MPVGLVIDYMASLGHGGFQGAAEGKEQACQCDVTVEWSGVVWIHIDAQHKVKENQTTDTFARLARQRCEVCSQKFGQQVPGRRMYPN